MSDPVRALNGASWDDGIASVAEAPLQGMITVRGGLEDPRIKAAVHDVTGLDMPAPARMQLGENSGLCWMSPDELLVLCPYASVQDHLDHMQKTLGDHHSLCVNVSDARAVFDLQGPEVRDVLAKLVPVDLSPDQFTDGLFRRTRMAQVPAAFWLHGPDHFRIVCFRSQARYVFDLLTTAAQRGSSVGFFAG
ncbi:MAG: sarcosine oxidase subunit gamma [Tateyamaria sp.]